MCRYSPASRRCGPPTVANYTQRFSKSKHIRFLKLTHHYHVTFLGYQNVTTEFGTLDTELFIFVWKLELFVPKNFVSRERRFHESFRLIPRLHDEASYSLICSLDKLYVARYITLQIFNVA